jgi:hypothetical protein
LYIFERDELIKDGMEQFAGSTQHHLAILGGSGIGKPSLALWIINHLDIKCQFCCCFLPCDSILMAMGLVVAILQVLKKKPSAFAEDPLAALSSCLASAGPVVLVLEDFGALWECRQR